MINIYLQFNKEKSLEKHIQLKQRKLNKTQEQKYNGTRAKIFSFKQV